MMWGRRGVILLSRNICNFCTRFSMWFSEYWIQNTNAFEQCYRTILKFDQNAASSINIFKPITLKWYFVKTRCIKFDSHLNVNQFISSSIFSLSLVCNLLLDIILLSLKIYIHIVKIAFSFSWSLGNALMLFTKLKFNIQQMGDSLWNKKWIRFLS